MKVLFEVNALFNRLDDAISDSFSDQPPVLSFLEAVWFATWFFAGLYLLLASPANRGINSSGIDYTGRLDAFLVVACCDNNSLFVNWLKVPGTTLGPRDRCCFTINLRAVLWAPTPPQIAYARTVFLRNLLVGHRVLAPTRGTIEYYSDEHGIPKPFPSVEIDNPTEVFLPNGTAVTLLLMQRGLVTFDRESAWLSPRERNIYEHYQAQAQHLRLGIWQNAAAIDQYDKRMRLLKLQREARASSEPLYSWAQLVLVLVLLTLLLVTRKGYSSWAELIILSWLPPSFLFLYSYTRFHGPLPPNATDPSDPMPYILVMCVALVTISAWLILLRGPLAEWQGAWIGQKAWQPISQFFITIWLATALIGIALHFMDARTSFPQSLSYAADLMFGLDEPHTTIATRLVALIWLIKTATILVFSARLPEARGPILPGRIATLMALGSYIAFFIVAVSAFTNIYLLGGSYGGFSPPINWSTAFWLAIDNFIGTATLANVTPTSTLMWVCWTIEAHIGLFFGLVVGGYIFSRIPHVQRVPS
jgi:hypothetical protein